MNPEKPRFAFEVATPVAEEICRQLRPVCERIIIAGSLRRLKPTVGDIEIVYVPKVRKDVPSADDFFELVKVNEAEAQIIQMTSAAAGILARRKNIKGLETFGAKNKLLVHTTSGIPVDLFATTQDCWFNYLVCRTGGARSNVEVCNAAIARGWKWNPYGPGFTTTKNGQSLERRICSEEEVFEFVGLPFRTPRDRH